MIGKYYLLEARPGRSPPIYHWDNFSCCELTLDLSIACLGLRTTWLHLLYLLVLHIFKIGPPLSLKALDLTQLTVSRLNPTSQAHRRHARVLSRALLYPWPGPRHLLTGISLRPVCLRLLALLCLQCIEACREPSYCGHLCTAHHD
jgi:hypothetical protein